MFGLAPLVIKEAVPAIVFVLSAVFICPSKKRKPAFVFFVLSLVLSAGAIESTKFYDLGNLQFWMTCFISVIVGSIVGLYFSLELQKYRKKKEA